MTTYPSLALLLAALQQDKVFIKILLEYIDFAVIFSINLVIELLKNIYINKHKIEHIKDKHLPYEPIFNLSLVELEILKTYIKTYIKTEFMQL